jgi:hypothetical protein
MALKVFIFDECEDRLKRFAKEVIQFEGEVLKMALCLLENWRTDAA